MFKVSSWVISLAMVAGASAQAHATCNGPSCKETAIVSKSCATLSGDIDCQQPFYLLADCEVYCDPRMGPDAITHHPLEEQDYAMLKEDEDGATSPVAGSFVVDGDCDGVPLLRFTGSLDPEQRYSIQATSEDYPELESIVVQFDTAAAPPTVPGRCGVDDQTDDDEHAGGCTLARHARGAPSAGFLVVLLLFGLRIRF